ncbi:unknown [Haloarcula marismortui ATCC 43049]|uniref:Uncharacterized protein n=1 Tax=Haloarcula marismortui (strain ATCC 43049 / DSM 3752 / JCM 8966 / VKM B-1809) TaxID=272569 RepID=Q5V4E8_HALMA|nr:hypothetical protein [Haloarcula marismortui]AAV45604.1 unknown [Haloarcula marismortui ATCC 43049]
MPSDDAPPLRFEKVDGRLLVTVDGTDEVLRADPSAAVEPPR